MAIRSNNKTIQFIKKWADRLERKPALNQPAFNQVLRTTHNITIKE